MLTKEILFVQEKLMETEFLWWRSFIMIFFFKLFSAYARALLKTKGSKTKS